MYQITGTMLSQEEIEKKVVELAGKIQKDYEGQDILLVGILKGASVFVADLMSCLLYTSPSPRDRG